MSPRRICWPALSLVLALSSSCTLARYDQVRIVPGPGTTLARVEYRIEPDSYTWHHNHGFWVPVVALWLFPIDGLVGTLDYAFNSREGHAVAGGWAGVMLCWLPCLTTLANQDDFVDPGDVGVFPPLPNQYDKSVAEADSSLWLSAIENDENVSRVRVTPLPELEWFKHAAHEQP